MITNEEMLKRFVDQQARDILEAWDNYSFTVPVSTEEDKEKLRKVLRRFFKEIANRE
jgi:hypothetical protein